MKVMQPVQEYDYSALQWVKGEIDETLNRARQALDAYYENPEDTGQMDICANYLHQVYGTLQMTELDGPVRLAEAMEASAKSLPKVEDDDQREAGIEVLMRATLQLPDYLDRLLTGHRDIPAALLPLINELRTSIKQSLLTDADLFTPDLSVQPPRMIDRIGGDVRVTARRLRPTFQAGLLEWLRDKQGRKGLNKLLAVVDELGTASSIPEVERLWWVAGGFMEVLQNSSPSESIAVRPLLAQLDRQIKHLMEDGEAALANDEVAALVTRMLYHVGSTKAGGVHAEDLRTSFGLGELLVSDDEIEAARAGLAGTNQALMRTVTGALREDLTAVMERLDIFTRQPDKDLQDLPPLVDKLTQMADTLAVLGGGRVGDRLRGQADVLQELARGEREADRDILMAVAEGLVEADANLGGLASGMTKQAVGEEAASTTEAEADAVRIDKEARRKQLLTAVLRQAQENISMVKEALGSYVKDPDGTAVPREAAKGLDEVRGSVQLLGYQRAAELFQRAGDYIQHALVDTSELPEDNDLERLAESIAGLEYYLEGLEQGRGEQGVLLDRIEEVLDKLTPPSGPAREPEEVPIPVEQAPSGEKQAAPEGVVEPLGAGEKPRQPSVPAVPVAPTAEAVPQPLSMDFDYPEQDMDASADPELLEIFIEEAEGEIESINNTLPQWRQNPEDKDALATLRRSFHTLKGSGRMVGAWLMGEFAWAFESMLNAVIEGKVQPSEPMFQLLDRQQGALQQMVAQLQGQGAPSADLRTMMAQAWALSRGELPEIGPVAEEKPMLPPQAPVLERDTVLVEIFAEEAEGHLDTLRAFVEDCRQKAEASCELTEPVLRALHTLVGSARMAQVDEVATVAASLQSYAKAVAAHNQRRVPDNGLDLLADGSTAIAGIIVALKQGAAELPVHEDIQQRAAALQQEMESGLPLPEPLGEQAEGEAAVAEVEQAEIPEQTPAATGPVVGGFLDDSGNLLAQAKAAREAWQADVDDFEAAAALMHAMERLKSGAYQADFQTIGSLASTQLELMDAAATGQVELSDSLFGLLGQLEDGLWTLLEQARDGRAPKAADALMLQVAEFLRAPRQAPGGEEEKLPELQAEQQPPVPEEPELPEAQAEQPETEAPKPEAFWLIEEHPLGERSEMPLGEEAEVERPEEPLLEEMHESEQAPVEEPGTEVIPSKEPPLEIDYGELDAEMLEVFVEEGGDIINNSEGLVQRLIADPGNTELLNELRRDLHTLKGGARLSGVTPIGDLAHAVESMVQGIADGHLSASSRAFELIQVSHDLLSDMVDQVKETSPLPDPARIMAQIEAYVERGVADELSEEEITALIRAKEPEMLPAIPEEEAGREAAAEAARERRGPSRVKQDHIRVRADLLNQLVNHAGEVSIARARIEEQVTGFGYNLQELEQTVIRLREQLRKLEIETEAQILFRHETEALNAEAEFDPLELDRYSTVQQLSRSLMESVADFYSIHGLLTDQARDAETVLVQQGRVNTELQEGLMRARMVPFAGLAPRLRRIIRQTAKELGKQVELRLEGADTELDRTVMDRMVAPLEHLIRNAVSHGIELPQERKAMGKRKTGTIVIALHREGQEVVIKVDDNGRGLNLDAIKRKALQSHMMEKGDRLADREIMQFILESGFSTAKEVSQISGRGVGLDVVSNEVKLTGGSLFIDSKAGEGTSFTIRLPLTLTVNQALLVEVSEELYAVPLLSIEAVTQLDKLELKELNDQRAPMLERGGRSYQYLPMAALLDSPEAASPSGGERQPVLLFSVGDMRVALTVDGLLGVREIVVKSVGVQLGRVREISGATILGDGRVVLILDMSALLRKGLSLHGQEERLSITAAKQAAKPAKAEAIRVMVVDDSITVRKVTTRLLKRHHIEVSAAKDGVDAVAMLEQEEDAPNIILMDIEMPRMDGFELATYVRSHRRFHDIPIVMITSRTGTKHRDRAQALGVNSYLGKPYQESELLDAIRELLVED